MYMCSITSDHDEGGSRSWVDAMDSAEALGWQEDDDFSGWSVSL